MATFLRSTRLHLTSNSLISSSSSSSSRTFTSTSAILKTAKVAAVAGEGEEKPRRILTFKTKSGLSNFKTFLPVTPSLRHLRQPISEHLHKGDPLRALTIAKRSSGGRNESGRITTRARGGGHKRRIRLVDFTRSESGEQEVMRIEYDPGRSAHIALIKHKVTGGMSYILAPGTLREGDTVQSFRSGIPDSFAAGGSTFATTPTPDILTVEPTSAFASRGSSSLIAKLSSTKSSTDPSVPQTVLPPTPTTVITPPKLKVSPASSIQIDLGVLRSLALRPGNCLPLRLIPPGTPIHALSLTPTGPFILARSAGTSARIISAVSEGGKHAQVKMSSGEIRLIGLDCLASIGVVSNNDHRHANLGKAGRMRWLGFRPQTRGVAMNATDHPHGGGRGKSKGNTHPVDLWNNGAKGQRTRKPGSKNGNKMVVKEREKKSVK